MRGHKGFTLTRDEIQNGINAQQFIRGLEKNADGSWIWTDKSVSSEFAQTAFPVIEDNGTTYTLADLDSLFGARAVIRTPSHDSIEVKKERLELAQLEDAFPSRPSSPLAPVSTGAQISNLVPQSNSTVLSKVSSSTATNNIDSTIVPISRPLQNSTSIAPIKPAGVDQRQTSSGVGKKRRRESAEPIRRIHRRPQLVKVLLPSVCITLLILVSYPNSVGRRQGFPTG